ncbi:MAG: alpha/beta hydrolase [Mariprofundaceae bacterium]
MNILFRLFAILLLAIGGSVAYMLIFESSYIYFPDRQVAQTPADIGLPFRDVRFKAADGTALHGWYMPHAHARFTLLHLHGNGGNIGNRLDQYRRWHALGLSILAFDYRGYGNSEGIPDEAGLHADAKAAWSMLIKEYGLRPEKIIIAGRSLGCAVAAKLAVEVNPAGLALEVPFTNIPDMSAAYYPWLPLRWFVHAQFDTEAAVRQTKAPLLLISAEADEIIPDGMADRVFAAHPGPKSRIALPGGHNNFDAVSKHPYFRLWQRWLNSLKAMKPKPVQWVRRNITSDS